MLILQMELQISLDTGTRKGKISTPQQDAVSSLPFLLYVLTHMKHQNIEVDNNDKLLTREQKSLKYPPGQRQEIS